MSVWIVVSRGIVVGRVTSDSYPEAQQLAAERYGEGVRITAPGQLQS